MVTTVRIVNSYTVIYKATNILTYSNLINYKCFLYQPITSFLFSANHSHFGMRQGIVGELTAAAVEELGKAHLLILKASLQLACRKIELLLPIQSNRYLANHLQASATPINVSMPDVHPCLLTRSNAGMSGRPPNKALWRYSK